MKIKIKYLLGLLLVGFGLLINQSFSDTVYIDTVTTPLLNGGDSASYLYTFKNSLLSFSTTSKIGWLGYSKYYNGITQYSILNNPVGSYQCTSTNTGEFNSSVFGYIPYSPGCTQLQNSYIWYNYTYTSTTNPIVVSLGNGTEFGKTFVGVQSANNQIPTYGFAKSFVSDSNNGTSFTTVSSSNSDYFRLFFEQNINLSSPLDGFNPITLSGDNMTGSYGRQYFYQRGTRTNYGYIIDDGQLYNKYKHFGLFGYGYSYSFLLGNSTITDMSWNDLQFVTVDDSIGDYQKLFGDVSSTEFNNLSWRGILVLRGNSYVSRGQDNGVYLLSKNPNNYNQILYEHWSCNTSNLDVIFSGGNSTVGSCIKLDGGYLTYNNSTNVMLFPSNSGTTTNSNSTSYPFVRSLIIGSDTNSLHGYTIIAGNSICINSNSVCYGFSTNTGVNLYQIYLSENPGHGGGGNNDWVGDGGSNNSLYFSCLGPVYNTSNGLPPYYCYDSDGNFNPDRLKGCWITADAGEDGELYEHIFCDVDGIQQEVTIIENGSGTSLVPCSGQCAGWQLGIISSGFSTGYFNNFFNSTGYFFKCPYPYSKKLVILPSLMNYLNGIDIALPINCFIAAFEHGKSFDFFDNVGLFEFGPLIQGNTSNHKILFRFFDFILIIWFVFFFTFIYKRFK